MKLKSILVWCIIFSALNNIDAQSNWVTFTKIIPEGQLPTFPLPSG
jgi:hypothetical protein